MLNLEAGITQTIRVPASTPVHLLGPAARDRSVAISASVSIGLALSRADALAGQVYATGTAEFMFRLAASSDLWVYGTTASVVSVQSTALGPGA